MKKLSFVAIMLVVSTALAFSQARPVLGILPFTGGAGGDGEAIATLISMEPQIMESFTVVPRTVALNAIFNEHYFQLAGLTDSDTIAGIGRMLNADYILSGNIRRLGDRNLIIATIVNVESFEQVAGYHRTYGTIEEVVDFLPSMSRTMIDATLGRGTATVPNLALLPFALAPGIDEQEAETLSMILAIEIINTGNFVVLPRTSTIQAALAEMDFQMLGYTDGEGMAALGRAINADLVLSAGVHRLGALNMFTTQVLHVADGSMFAGASRVYQVIADGIDLMAELAVLLTGGEIQARPVLGILPFTGGVGGDGEAIATLISMEPGILEAFTVVPRTAALNAIFDEHYFQLAGLTDSDTIAGIGRMLNADYVLSGNIRRLGDRNLVIATIVNVESFEQVAGYHRTYGTIEEVIDFLPSMSRTMINATLGRGIAEVPNLALLPFTLAPGIDEQEAETLSMILAIEIINTGNFVVLPRTSTIQAALAEMDFQMLGYTDDEGMAALGRAINADLVLSAGVHRLGVLNIFTAQVLRVADGSMFAGASRNYQVIADGIDLMAELAVLLTGGEIIARPLPIPMRPGLGLFADPARFWSIGITGNISTVELTSGVLAAGTSLHATLAPFRFSFIRLGCDLIFGMYDETDFSSTSIYPFLHYALFLPFTGGGGGWYIGTGAGFMMTSYSATGRGGTESFIAMDFTTGFKFRWLNISYTLRTNFSAFTDRFAIGFNFRFQSRGVR